MNRGRGRQTRVSTRSTPTSPLPVLVDGNSPLDVVVDCLNKLNNQNKRLLEFVGTLAESLKSQPIESASLQVAPVEDSVIVNVNNRLEKVEQSINSTTLICHGPAVDELVKEASPRGVNAPEIDSSPQNTVLENQGLLVILPTLSA